MDFKNKICFKTIIVFLTFFTKNKRSKMPHLNFNVFRPTLPRERVALSLVLTSQGGFQKCGFETGGPGKCFFGKFWFAFYFGFLDDRLYFLDRFLWRFFPVF